ncbi:MAG: cupin domain-containing protein [Alphaproteobacteria bacterium]|nr:cupin domain-containing protein [Alphaproteobacteria bacterium]
MDVKIDPVTEKEKARWPKEVIVPMPDPFMDARGAIQPLVDEDMKSCVLISSKKGTVRANHYHKTDRHYCYVLAGKIEYYHRPTGSDAAPEKVMVEAGQMFFTPPMVDHSMVFPEEAVFITWGRNSRLQEVYEADVVRIDPIEPS